MTVLLTLTLAGTNTGPTFNLYSNVDGFVAPFETNVPKASLVAGYSSILVPDTATTVRVKSIGSCTTQVDIILTGFPTPPANIFGFGSTGNTNPATACTLNDDSVDLYSPDAVLGLGSILYTDLAMTLPFDGLGWSWHTGGLPGNTFVISGAGVILGGAVCT